MKLDAVPEWVRKHILVNENGCWIWQRWIDIGGYGRLYLGASKNWYQREIKVHRFIYELFNGPVPKGLEIDHLCRVRACCNPHHLEAVTHSTNLLRGVNRNREKTHCPKGHPLSGNNVYIQKGTGTRSCKICRLEANRRWILKQSINQI